MADSPEPDAVPDESVEPESSAADVQQDVSREDEETLQEQVEEKKQPQRKLFGTFSGVFTPTLLTILGVIMYLREGWVVGHAGLAGAWLIILLSFGITAFTGLSLSSIVTNIRIGAGGAFSIISQSLGLEVGGSVGVPLYLSQALAVSMYVFGFRAGWLTIFPGHNPLVVDLAVFVVLFGIAFVSAGLAFKIQYVIMAAIAVSLVSIGVAAARGSMTEPVQWWGQFGKGGTVPLGFWAIFAVFFPASTGIMAGANMSGDLKNPRRSIPVGTLSAIALSLVIYLALAYWLARSASADMLKGNYTIMIDKAAWSWAILAGLLGATFSSALSSLVGAPRILQALGDHDILPAGKWLARRTAGGEPRNALYLTAVLVLGALMLRNLNAVAPLITMFFLITYAMINVVVLLEQSMKLVSFRPLLRVPRFVSALGAAGCIFAMFIVNPVFSIIAVAVVLALHAVLIRKHLRAPFGDVRSGLFVAVAEWAARKVGQIASNRERTWKANLLAPVERIDRLRGQFDFIRDLCYPKGFVKLVGLTGRTPREELVDKLPQLTEDFKDQHIFTSWTVISAASFGDNLEAGIETFGGTFFRPNLLFLEVPRERDRFDEVDRIVTTAHNNRIGLLMLHEHPEAGLGQRRWVNVWFNNRGPDWELSMDLGNQDLAILIGYKLKLNWGAKLRLVAPLEDDTRADKAHEFLEQIADLARIPNVTVVTQPGRIDDVDAEVDIGPADLNIIPVSHELDFNRLHRIASRMNSSCLFTVDGGQENALA